MNALEKWLENHLAESSRPGNRSTLLLFENYVKTLDEPFKTLDEMVEFQQNAEKKDRYKIARLAVEFSQKRGGTHDAMSTRNGQIRSFFLYHNAALERVSTNFHATHDSVQSLLNEDVLKDLINNSDFKDKAILLTLFQSMMDESRFQIFNKQYAEKLVKHLKEKGVDEPFKIDFLRGRKRNKKAYDTLIGRDGLEAWRVYFERERKGGWPNPGEALALDALGKPISSQALRRTHLYKLRKLGYVKEVRKGKNVGAYGYGLHNLRDLARSILDTIQGTKLNKTDPDRDAFNANSAEYWMGHTIDPMGYNQMHNLDPTRSPKQYRIAESRLNIISHIEHPDISKEIDDKITERLDELTPFFEETLATLYSAMTYGREEFKSFPDNKSLKDKLEEIRHLPIKEKAKALKKLKEEVLERAEDVNMMLESQMTQKMTQEEKQDAIDTAEEAKKSR